ncbi:hypothetical protein ABK040_006645 [Willaertia magna]
MVLVWGLRAKKMLIGGGGIVSVGVGYQQKRDYENRKAIALEFLVDRPSNPTEEEENAIIIGNDEQMDRLIAEERKKEKEKIQQIGLPSKEELEKKIRDELLDTRRA